MIYFYMNRDDFISIDAIRFGWNGLKNNLRFFLVLMIIVAVLYNLPSLIATYFFKFQIPDGTPSSQDLSDTPSVGLCLHDNLSHG